MIRRAVAEKQQPFLFFLNSCIGSWMMEKSTFYVFGVDFAPMNHKKNTKIVDFLSFFLIFAIAL